MKTARQSLDHIISESGSMVLQIIVLGVVFSILGAAVMSYLGRQADTQASRRIADELQNLSTTLEMIYSNREACGELIKSGAFGSSLTSLSQNVQIRLPAPSSKVIKADVNYNQVQINKAYFQKPIQIHQAQPIYIANLVIEAKDSGPANSVRQTSVPFYFFTDKGVFSCFATAILDPAKNTTVEDSTCQQYALRLAGKTPPSKPSIYSPTSKTCVEGP